MRLVWFVAPLLLSGCLLTQSLSGLSGGPDAGPDADAGAPDAANEAAPPADAARDGAEGVVPIAFVQGSATAAGSSSSTISVRFDNPVKPHSAVIVAVALVPATLTLQPVKDSLGSAFTVVSGPWIGNGANHYIAVALDTAGGANTVEASFSGEASTAYVYVHEYAGIATSAAFDQASSRNGVTAAPDGMNSGPVTTTWPHELVFGFGETRTAAPGTGFTARSLFSDNVTEDRIVDTLGSYQATGTMTTGTDWAMMVTTFRGR